MIDGVHALITAENAEQWEKICQAASVEPWYKL